MPEKLKSLANLDEPDIRSTMWGRFDPDTKEIRSIELCDHYHDIKSVNLSAHVPETVCDRFNTAKNLYIYSWYVFTFRGAAELAALACVEAALRARLDYKIQVPKTEPWKAPTLKELLRLAIKEGLLKNEGFANWHHRVKQNAKQRVQIEMIRKMQKEGLTEIEYDDADIKPNADDMSWDYVENLKSSLPRIRNMYAHGRLLFHPHAFTTIQIASQLINQLYPARLFKGKTTTNLPHE